jgi:tetratricopeptide (TPR) repeat protein
VRRTGTALLVAAVTVLVFWPATRLPYLDLDDDVYATGNRFVANGLTAEGVKTALTTFTAFNWHPATWLSLMLDTELFGMGPGGHHAVNLALHAANAALLFLVLARLTGAAARACLVALLFAVHPLRVESVAWISERKDVLAGLFFLLTLAAYARFTRAESGRRLWYAAALALYAAGLMAKPMLVTLPLVLLLVDFWPLGRCAGGASLRGLVVEKVPFLALATASSIVTVIAQKRGGSLASLAMHPLAARVAAATVAPARYLAKTFWPRELSLVYPLPSRLPFPALLGAAALLAGATAAAVALRRRRPYLFTGWLWFLVMLVPVLGLVQAGRQSIADRYTYLPVIGIAIAVVWGAAEAVEGRPSARVTLAAAALALVALLAVRTRVQLAFWKDSETLFVHSLSSGGDDALVRNNYGFLLGSRGRPEDARAQFAAAVALNPGYVLGRLNLGLALTSLGRVAEAEAEYRAALSLAPESARGHERLGTLYLQLGRNEEAAKHLSEAVRLDPESGLARSNLAAALRRLGRTPHQ